jgi:hypothetical protein
MGRKRYSTVPRQARNQVDLDRDLNTSATQPDGDYDHRRARKYEKTEQVPPPFKGEEGGGYLRRSEVSLASKLTAIAASVVMVAVVPAVWFAATINKDVSDLTEEVSAIKQKTEQLLGTSIRNEERLKNAEHSIGFIENYLQRGKSAQLNKAH